MNTLARVSAKLYEFLLLAYPRHFRRKYGDEMASVFMETWRHAYQRYGLYGVLGVWFATIDDLVCSACAEHLSTFLSTRKRDRLSISRAPMFGAASGALIGLASPWQWYMFSLVLLCTIFTVILFDRLMTLRSSILKASNRNLAASASILGLSLANKSEKDDV